MFVSPMLAKKTNNVDLPTEGYLFEVKWDGIRAIIVTNRLNTEIWSRNGRVITQQFPEIVDAISRTRMRGTYDAEIVVFDHGVPSFPQATSRLHLGDASLVRQAAVKHPATAILFDVIVAEYQILEEAPLEHRRTWLNMVKVNDNVRISRSYEDGEKIMDEVAAMNMEGLIAKRKGSLYKPGRRTKDWLKFKLMYEEDVIVIGYTAGVGKRQGLFGALVTQDADGNYVGRVGTGFTDDELKVMYDILQSCGPVKVKPGEFALTKSFGIRVRGMRKNESNAIREPVFLRISL